MPEFPMPTSILENAKRRRAVVFAYTHRPCRAPGCDQPATHWPATGQPACEEHRRHPAAPVSDPARRLYALRDQHLAERLLLEEEQLLTVRIRYEWHPDWPQPWTSRRAA